MWKFKNLKSENLKKIRWSVNFENLKVNVWKFENFKLLDQKNSGPQKKRKKKIPQNSLERQRISLIVICFKNRNLNVNLIYPEIKNLDISNHLLFKHLRTDWNTISAKLAIFEFPCFYTTSDLALGVE